MKSLRDVAVRSWTRKEVATVEFTVSLFRCVEFAVLIMYLLTRSFVNKYKHFGIVYTASKIFRITFLVVSVYIKFPINVVLVEGYVGKVC